MVSRSADVVVIGDGIIALASALAAAGAGASCIILGRSVPGAASAASGGLLAPSIGSANESFRSFMLASRDRYPAWVSWLTDRTGEEIALNRMGILELAPPNPRPAPAEELTATALQSLEPEIVHDGRALLFRDDGYVNNVQLLAVLRTVARAEPRITIVDDHVIEIDARQTSCTVRTEDGQQLAGGAAVVAAGAWSAGIRGLPRAIPVEPVRGQMVQLEGCPLTHAVSLADAYLVPRGTCTVVGSTIERVGFDVSTTRSALEMLHQAAGRAVPALQRANIHSRWAGLRPMTPDGMPLIGRDPDRASVVYACGHGKNGILLAPITGECVAALISNGDLEFDIAQYRIDRFDSGDNSSQYS